MQAQDMPKRRRSFFMGANELTINSNFLKFSPRPSCKTGLIIPNDSPVSKGKSVFNELSSPGSKN